MADGNGKAGLAPANLAFVEQLYFEYLRDPASVEQGWRDYFSSLAPTPAPPARFDHSIFGRQVSYSPAAAVTAPAAGETSLDERARRMVEAYRTHGHRAADLDPLGLVRREDARLAPAAFGITARDLDAPVHVEEVAGGGRMTVRELLALLRETYCRHIGVETSHISVDTEIRTWIEQRVESTRNRYALDGAARRELLSDVVAAETFEQFLHTKFVGAKRFSLEGAESLIPLLRRALERAARGGVRDARIGMAHRGRLTVLANIVEKPAADIFSEFLDREVAADPATGGDVKYHLGYSHDVKLGGAQVHVSLAFNPSHLEWVDPVVQGRVRARQDRVGDAGRRLSLPVLIHGDAAFAGQGVVAETLNMSRLRGYTVGGTLHIVINNQIGFTTTGPDEYSGTYATNIARSLSIPILHVNGEDPEAVAQVVDLAIDFRERFGRDVVIDLWCYRKFGHNEGDEPSFTQPLMYRRIADKPPIRDAYLAAFAAVPPPDGSPPLTENDAHAMADELRAALERELARALASSPAAPTPAPALVEQDVRTAVAPEILGEVGRALTTLPQGFHLHPKLARLIESRREMGDGQRPIDWGMAEALAFGTLLRQGVRVRLSGQDARRGTFSHRHSLLLDYQTGEEYMPLQHVSPDQAGIQIWDSPLSEAGVLGFEYGYSIGTEPGLVIWEAQFGDFVNGAQVIVDQFLVSSEVKWKKSSGLVVLLPHGMEGQGPEHSSGRLERFLALAVNDNMQVCNLTTPAQYFHLLRRQALQPIRKPLVLMAPKSLLRLPAAVSTLQDLQGGFRGVLADPEAPDPSRVRRILLCTGKIYYELAAARAEQKRDDVAILRLERLYPLVRAEVMETLSRYREGTPILWVQEEPRNMGAWDYVNRELPAMILGSFPWSCVSRPRSPSPATGSASRHKAEQAHLIDYALTKGRF